MMWCNTEHASVHAGKRQHAAIRRAFVLLLVAGFVIASLSGCRYSDVLTEHIWQEGAEIDETQVAYKNVDDATERDFQSYKRSHTDNIDDQAQELPTFSDLPTSVQESERAAHAQDVIDRGEASEGTEAGAQENAQADDQSKNGSKGAQSGTKDGPGSNTAGEANPFRDSSSDYTPFEASRSPQDQSQDDQQSGSSDEAQDSSVPKDNQQNSGSGITGGSGGTAKVYNDGTYTELPQNTHKVAAVGQYALIVQMLAGEGALVAADQEWLQNVRASAAFPGEGLENVAVGWSGNGKTAGSADVQAIINAHPDVVLTATNYASITQDDADALREAGIDVVVMPAIDDEYTLDADIVTAVQVVGELLKNANSDRDSRAMANDYVSFHNDVLANVRNANGGYTWASVDGSDKNHIYQGGSFYGQATDQLSSTRYFVAYINGWDVNSPTATTSMDSWETGLPISTDFREERSWHDNRVYPALQGSPYSLSGLGSCSLDTTDGWAIIPSIYHVNYPNRSTISTGRSRYPLIDYYLQHSGAYDTDLNSTVYSLHGPKGWARENLLDFGLWFSQVTPEGANYVSVGEAQFPGVIVKSSEIARHLKASGEKPNGFYNYGLPYKAWVAPTGLAGSWGDGTVESFLVAPLMYNTLQNGGNLSDTTTLVNQFYTKFYRCDHAAILQEYGTVIDINCPNATSDGRYQDSSEGTYYKTPGVLHGQLSGS